MTARRRGLRVVLTALAAVLVIAVGTLLLALPFIVDLPRAQALVRSEASRLLDRPVRFDRVSLSYWPLPAVRITRLVVANPSGFGPDPLLFVAEARVRVRLLPLLRGSLQFGEITLARPRVVVEQRADGAWNLPAPGSSRPAPAAPFVLVSRVRLRGGRVEVRLPGESARPVVAHLVDRIDLTLDDLGWSHPIRFRMAGRLPGGGLTLEVEGEVGPLAVARADLAALPARLVARLRVEETRPSPGAGFLVTGQGEGTVRAEGLLGQLGGDGRLAFARVTLGHRPAECKSDQLRTLTLEGVELPIRIAGPVLTVQPFVFRMAGGLVRGEATLTWHAGTPGVRLAGIRVQGVAAEALLVDFLCQPYAVTGRLDGSGALAFAGTGDDLLRSAQGTWQVQLGPGRLVGPAALTLLAGVVRVGTALQSMLSLDVPRTLFGSPLDFQAVTAAGTVGGAELRIREVAMTSRQLRVVGRGTYGFIDTRVDASFDVETGRTSFGVKLGGTAQQPSYVLIPRSLFRGVTDVLSPLLDATRRTPRPPSFPREDGPEPR